jgi:hypothetical protein
MKGGRVWPNPFPGRPDVFLFDECKHEKVRGSTGREKEPSGDFAGGPALSSAWPDAKGA